MSPVQMLQRSDHVFIGVIEQHEFEKWPFFRVPGQASSNWRILRRRIRVENVLRGVETRKQVDIYEIYGAGGASGDWNSTQDGERALFLVRVENGRYHVVRDWWRSIFQIHSGAHSRLPLDEARPFWERVALVMWWLQPGWSEGITNMGRNDPGHVLGRWRAVKILRGFLQSPDDQLRRFACRALIDYETGQDECWTKLSPEDQAELKHEFEAGVQRKSLLEPHSAAELWDVYAKADGDRLRLLTTESNIQFRAEFCHQFIRHLPNDRDNGCTAEKAFPATIVTNDGDVPLIGRWPVANTRTP